MMLSLKISDIAIITVHGTHCFCTVNDISKSHAIPLLENSVYIPIYIYIYIYIWVYTNCISNKSILKIESKTTISTI